MVSTDFINEARGVGERVALSLAGQSLGLAQVPFLPGHHSETLCRLYFGSYVHKILVAACAPRHPPDVGSGELGG